MGAKITVFGSYITDFTARTHAFPKPGETIIGTGFQMGPGGKASNQAIAAHKLGADVTYVTKLGTDAFGTYAKEYYESLNISTDGFLFSGADSTGAANIFVNEETGQNSIVVVPGIGLTYDEADMAHVKKFIGACDILLQQLEVNLYATEEALRYARKQNVLSILNPAPAVPLREDLLALVDIITPNETEATILTGITVDGQKENTAAAAKKLVEMGAGKVIITLGANGAYAYDGTDGLFIPPLNVKAVDTTGAGDAYNGGLAAALSQGMDFFTAARFGGVVGGLCVTKEGTAPSMPERDLVYTTFEQLEQE